MKTTCVSVRAEDASGSFGILPRHADFLTSLAISRRELAGRRRRRGTTARCGAACSPSPAGRTIAIATREAVPGDDLATLDETVLAPLPRRHRDRTDRARREHAAATQRDPPDHAPSASGRARWRRDVRMTTPENRPRRTGSAGRGRRGCAASASDAWQREGEPSVARRLAQIGVLGWIIVVPMLIGVFVGRWLDRTFGIGMFWTGAAADARRWRSAAGRPGNGCRAHELPRSTPAAWAMLLGLAAHLAAGSARRVYFAALWWNARLFAAGGGTGSTHRADARPLRAAGRRC